MKKPLKYTDEITEKAATVVNKYRTQLQPDPITVKKKYAKKKPAQLLRFREGYDLLENLMLVRLYVQRKYNMEIKQIEFLLYLYPKKIFTYWDYFQMPRPGKFYSVTSMLKMGLIKEVSKGRVKRDSLFKLSHTSCKIVEEFYQYLSGEKPIPIEEKNIVSETSTYEKMKRSLIRTMNAAGPDEKKKGYYE